VCGEGARYNKRRIRLVDWDGDDENVISREEMRSILVRDTMYRIK
jgi:hypothetical protein